MLNILALIVRGHMIEETSETLLLSILAKKRGKRFISKFYNNLPAISSGII